MVQPEIPDQPPEPHLMPAEAEQDLSTIVLDLPSPDYHGYTSGYYQDVRSKHALQVVGLLHRLRNNNTSRDEAPVIATYAGGRPEEIYIDAHERAIARAIVDQASETGLRVTVVSGRSVYGETYQKQDNGRRGIALSGLRKLLRHKHHRQAAPEPAVEYDFQLKIWHEFDMSSEEQDSLKDTWSYKRIRHAISLLPASTAASEPS